MATPDSWGFDASVVEPLMATVAVEEAPLPTGQAYAQPGASPDNVFIANLPVGIDDDVLWQVFSTYGVVTQCKAMPNSKGFAAAGLVRFASAEEAAWVVENVTGTIPAGCTEPVAVKFANPKGKGKGKDAWGSYGKGQEDSAWRATPYGKGGQAGEGGWGMDSGKGSWSTDAGKGIWTADAGWDSGSGKGKKGKEASVATIGIKMIVDGLCSSGCLPGGEGYTNDANTLFVGGLPSDTTDLELYKIFASFGSLAPKGVTAMMGDEGCKGIAFVNFMEDSAAQNAIATLNGCKLPNGSVLKVSIKRAGSAKGKDKGEKGKGKGKGKFKGKAKDPWEAQGKDGWADSWT